MAFLASTISNELGLRVLMCPIGSNVVIRTASCAVGIGLPIYSTFKAIEKKDRSEQEKWLLYWAAYGSFSLVEVFSDKILYWVPFYYHMKFAFLVWLQLPSGNGSKHIYERHLRPFLEKHQAKLDQLLGSVCNELEKFISNHEGEIQLLKAVALRCASTANRMVKDFTQPLPPSRPGAIEGRNQPVDLQNDDSDADIGSNL